MDEAGLDVSGWHLPVPEELSDLTMPWSLGMLGDLMWQYLPQSRPLIVQAIGQKLKWAVTDDGPLLPLMGSELISDILFDELILPAMSAWPTDEGECERLLAFVEFGLRYRGVGAGLVEEALVLYVIHSIVSTPDEVLVRRVWPPLAPFFDRYS